MARKPLAYRQLTTVSAAITVCNGISVVRSAVVAAGGSGFLVNEKLTFVGGTALNSLAAWKAVVIVRSVDQNGSILTFDVFFSGAYTSKPSNAVALTGGTGSGATLTVTWLDNKRPTGATHAEVIAEAKDCTYQGDGVAPTATTGMVLEAQAAGVPPLVLVGAEIENTQFIETSASAKLDIQFYKE